ncbi:MAG TPA: hypothetical protein VFY83_16235, partial [Anaerolineales bacterium]|nr:hypothetical protein [Anaerolineales bacterium]
VITLLFFAANLGLYYYQRWGSWLLGAIRVPRLNRMLRQGEFSTVSLGDVLTYTFNLPSDWQKRIAPMAGGVAIGLVIIVLAWMIYRFFLQKNWSGKYSLANILMVGCLLVGTIFPAAVYGSSAEPGCMTDFLTYYEEAGRAFADLLPPGSVVYWKGSGRHLAFMLYVDNVKLFPPQIHAGGGYMSGDTQQLLRFGIYNEEMDKQWRESADILVFWPTYVTKEVRDFLDQPGYERVPFDMGKLAQCEDELLVYRRTP